MGDGDGVPGDDADRGRNESRGGVAAVVDRVGDPDGVGAESPTPTRCLDNPRPGVSNMGSQHGAHTGSRCRTILDAAGPWDDRQADLQVGVCQTNERCNSA